MVLTVMKGAIAVTSHLAPRPRARSEARPGPPLEPRPPRDPPRVGAGAYPFVQSFEK